MSRSPRISAVPSIVELTPFYANPPDGVRANMIFSADGAAAFGGRAGPLSCATDQRLLKILRGLADVVLVGAGTARAENYGPVTLGDAARARRCHEGRPEPPPVAVVSRSGDLPARLLRDPDRPPILVTCESTAARCDLDADLQHILVAGEDSVDVSRALGILREQGMGRILCEGGPTLLDELVEADAVDEICVTIAPKLAAGQPVGHRRHPARLRAPVSMNLDHALVCEGYLYLKYSR
ncbi:pyrimidine reductase family protein [Mycobacterium sp. 94-17]|uniref:pyrimidine reductase family protein n=1 Tax=Mycobacterium sp. 94-17 TaxID=2986147 RepID=UPI002D1F76AE|nr:pyrimidine reductase family protein [Mycobacterium sp. 94-17]MEB4211540.1 pyrimidine reductase family protein [Mycobacterium sp. 94-17]